MGSKQINLTGTRFNKLVVIKKIESRNYGNTKKRMWECICDCGNTIIVNTSALTSSNTKSCGCLKNISNAENSRSTRHKIAKLNAGFRSILSSYISNANNKNVKFELTVEQFYELLQKDCFYCGIKPSNVYDKRYYNIVYNGVDRKDNSIGYTLENSVPCCKMCNISKNKNHINDFISWALRLNDNILKNKTIFNV